MYSELISLQVSGRKRGDDILSWVFYFLPHIVLWCKPHLELQGGWFQVYFARTTWPIFHSEKHGLCNLPGEHKKFVSIKTLTKVADNQTLVKHSGCLPDRSFTTRLNVLHLDVANSITRTWKQASQQKADFDIRLTPCKCTMRFTRHII